MFSQEVALAEKDAKAKGKVPQASLEKLYWGLGIGLQKCEDGSMIAFHWGDSNTVRNFAALKLNTDGSYQAVTCLTNSANGPLVFQPLCEPIVGDLTPIANWLSGREGLKMQRNAEVLAQKPAMAGRAEALTPLKTTYEKNVPIFSNKVTETEVVDSTVKLQHKPK